MILSAHFEVPIHQARYNGIFDVNRRVCRKGKGLTLKNKFNRRVLRLPTVEH